MSLPRIVFKGVVGSCGGCFKGVMWGYVGAYTGDVKVRPFFWVFGRFRKGQVKMFRLETLEPPFARMVDSKRFLGDICGRLYFPPVLCKENPASACLPAIAGPEAPSPTENAKAQDPQCIVPLK